MTSGKSLVRAVTYLHRLSQTTTLHFGLSGGLWQGQHELFYQEYLVCQKILSYIYRSPYKFCFLGGANSLSLMSSQGYLTFSE